MDISYLYLIESFNYKPTIKNFIKRPKSYYA